MAEEICNSSFITHKGRQVPQVPAQLCRADRLGHWKARWGVHRMRYSVEPGLYAVGTPTDDSPVLVTANYKMSFDRLRSQLTGRSVWIMVIDTKGINVWCAAGKGTFGTDEIVKRIEAIGLKDIVAHRKLILPQLSAPGVAAGEVKRQTGFGVIYGPVRAEDLPAFFDAGMKATDRMRRVEFGLYQRIVLIPIEFIFGTKHALLIAAGLLLLAGVNRSGYSAGLVVARGLPSAALVLLTYLAGIILGPVLLPWLPGRAFSVKGIWIGLAMVAALRCFAWPLSGPFGNQPAGIGWLLIIPALTSFIVMNFTGASTYTSLSGVKREMKIAVPLQAVVAVVGLGSWIAGLFV